MVTLTACWSPGGEDTLNISENWSNQCLRSGSMGGACPACRRGKRADIPLTWVAGFRGLSTWSCCWSGCCHAKARAARVAAIVPVMSILGAAPEGDGGSSRFVGRFSGASTQAVEALLLSRDGRSRLRLTAPQAGRPQLRSPLWTALRGPQCPAGSQCQQMPNT